MRLPCMPPQKDPNTIPDRHIWQSQTGRVWDLVTCEAGEVSHGTPGHTATGSHRPRSDRFTPPRGRSRQSTITQSTAGQPPPQRDRKHGGLRCFMGFHWPKHRPMGLPVRTALDQNGQGWWCYWGGSVWGGRSMAVPDRSCLG